MFITAIGIIFNTFILMYAARYMDIYDAYFGKFFLIALLYGICSVLFNMPSAFLNWVLAAVICTLLIKYILNESFGRSLMVYIVMVVTSFIVGFILAILLIGASCFAI
ncbi:hypothetical protein J7L05_01600 [bacterium]|nr:hypothetical protein [bacterium]